MFRRNPSPQLGMYDAIRRFFKAATTPTEEGMRRYIPGEPYQPFGPNFGITVFPDFITAPEMKPIRKQYVDIYLREKAKDVDDSFGENAQVSDGRLQLPPLHPSSFASIVRRLEDMQAIPRDHVNNQTVNLYEPGDFIRAHVDNLFLYDDIFVVLSLGSPAEMKLTHIQNGEELRFVIPDRSVYVMEGPSRYVYFHSVMPLESQRLSIVLRRNFLRTTGTYGVVPEQMKGVLAHKGNALAAAFMGKQIGSTRIALTDEWMDEQNLGTFDTAEMVKRLKPLRDWSLRSQLDEDYERYLELKRADALFGMDFEWRFAELRKAFTAMEEEITINKDSLSEPSVPGAEKRPGLSESEATGKSS